MAQCYSQRESTADRLLKGKGFETYLPRIKEAAINCTRRIAPLFPGYLFVRINISWYPILATVGVLRLLRVGDEPCKIDDALVTRIQKQEFRGLVRLPDTRLKIGDNVRILRGSFKDHIGVFAGMHGKARSKVLLELLGREVPIELSVDDLEALHVAI